MNKIIRCVVKKKYVDSSGKVIGIMVYNGKTNSYIPKNRFCKYIGVSFLNAKISSDGKVIATNGKIPVEVYDKKISKAGIPSKGSIITLYHGSDKIVGNPVFGQGSNKNDYGKGFYCTRDYNLAGEWACKSGISGYINKYEIDCSGMKVLNLSSKSYTDIMKWVAILVENREFSTNGRIMQSAKDFLKKKYLIKNYTVYDIIRGYRADDSYFMYTRDFLSGAISYEKFSNAIFLGKLGVQDVLISKKAFDEVVYKGYERADEKYIKRYTTRDTSARRGYINMEDTGSLDILEIMRRGY